MWQWLVGAYVNNYAEGDRFTVGQTMRTRYGSTSLAEAMCTDTGIRLVGRIRIKAINEEGMARFVEAQKKKQRNKP
ncbi:hypothetical protein EV128_125145 [Rhizobium azibense]|nr:hypothetical protein EV128_125145 [Rhizobium azibense]